MTNCVQVCRAFTCGRCVKYHDDSLPAGHPRKCSESHAVPKKEIKCCSTLLPGQETNTTRRNSPSAAFFSDDNRRALSFEDAFDGELKVRRRRLKKCVKSVDDDADDDYTSSDRASEDDHLHEGRYRSIATFGEWRNYRSHYCD